jgi:hypothetical protein
MPILLLARMPHHRDLPEGPCAVIIPTPNCPPSWAEQRFYIRPDIVRGRQGCRRPGSQSPRRRSLDAARADISAFSADGLDWPCSAGNVHRRAQRRIRRHAHQRMLTGHGPPIAPGTYGAARTPSILSVSSPANIRPARPRLASLILIRAARRSTGRGGRRR